MPNATAVTMDNHQSNTFAINNITNICNLLNINSAQILTKLNNYTGLLTLWQKKINLVSNADLPYIYYRHIYNSLQLLPYILYVSNNNLFNVTSSSLSKTDEPTVNIVDFGSGAGFPGLILALFNHSNNYYLIESNTKKCAFLNTVVATLQLENVKVVNSNANNIGSYPTPQIIIARGLSPLANLVQISLPHIHNNAVCLFLKGEESLNEVNQTESMYTNLNITILKNKLAQNADNNWQIVAVAKKNKPIDSL